MPLNVTPFPQVIIGAPTLLQRKDILSVLCARMPVCPSVDLAELARNTTGYVGADLSALCREAAMNAIRDNSKVNTANYWETKLCFLALERFLSPSVRFYAGLNDEIRESCTVVFFDCLVIAVCRVQEGRRWP